jgi:hypothetical protein
MILIDAQDAVLDESPNSAFRKPIIAAAENNSKIDIDS